MKVFRFLNDGDGEMPLAEDISVVAEGGSRMRYLREIQTAAWINLSERNPTEADANEDALVLVHTGRYFDMIRWDRSSWDNTIYTHFLPIPRFEKADKDAAAFDKWFSDAANRKVSWRELWDAAIAYARST